MLGIQSATCLESWEVEGDAGAYPFSAGPLMPTHAVQAVMAPRMFAGLPCKRCLSGMK